MILFQASSALSLARSALISTPARPSTDSSDPGGTLFWAFSFASSLSTSSSLTRMLRRLASWSCNCSSIMLRSTCVVRRRRFSALSGTRPVIMTIFTR